MDRDREGTADAGTSVLLLGPTNDPAARTCVPGRAGGSDDRPTVAIVYGHPKHARTADRRGYDGDGSIAGRITIDPPVSEGVPTRSAAAAEGRDGAAEGHRSVVETVVASPRDLAGLWVAIGLYLDELAACGERVAVCFDSLSTLLGHVSTDRVYRFVGLLVERLRRANAVSHFHLDPASHDRGTVEDLCSLFDVTIVEPSSPPSDDAPVGPSKAVSAVLAASERRSVFEYLLEAGGRATLSDLAAEIVATNRVETSIETARLVLYHDHLPRLAAAGLVAFDSRTERVELLASAEELAWLAADVDRGSSRSTPEDR